jgi:nitroreductase/dihydropteridine reductase
MHSFLNHLEWRHATKAFDPNKKVGDPEMGKILQAIRMAPTSYGLQPFEVVAIKDQALKQKLSPHAWNQPQVATCSTLLVFVARTNINGRIDDYFNELSGRNADARAGFKDYEAMMRGSFQGKNEEELKSWASRQAYIALGFGLAACAELQIDSCPMEGFVGPEFDKILGLEKGFYSVCLLTVGYRDPAVPPKPKFRFSEHDLIKHK